MALRFRRKSDDTAYEQYEAPDEQREGTKGRPTPKRKDAEAAARARAKPPRTRKELARRDRELRSEKSGRIRKAMREGDERYFLPRDQGVERRFIRDFVDRRFTIVEMMLPLLIVALVLGYSGNTALMQASTLVMFVTILFVAIDLVVLRFRLRKELQERFPDESHKGTTYYAVMRAMQMRFMRMPKAQVKIGQELPDDYS